MKTYKVVVKEIHTYERSYYVNADNQKEAKQIAKTGGYEDADAGEFVSYDIKGIVSIEESDTDITYLGKTEDG